MGTLQELRQRLSFLQQTIGEIVQQFRNLRLSSDEVCDCLNILDNTKGKVEVVLEGLRDVAYAAKPGKAKKKKQAAKRDSEDDISNDVDVTIKTECSPGTITCDTSESTENTDEKSFNRALNVFQTAFKEATLDDENSGEDRENPSDSDNEDHAYQLKCKLCEKRFENEDKLCKHERCCSSEAKPFNILACPICDHQFIKRDSLKKHMAACQRRNQHICEECTRTFRNEKDLNKHLSDHSAGRLMYRCMICGKAYANQKVHWQHKQSHHNLACNICGKSYRSSQTLKKHELACQERSPHTCPTCNKDCKTHETLQKHDRVHAKTKPFVCKICKRRFKAKTNLRIHLTNHIAHINNSLKNDESELLEETDCQDAKSLADNGDDKEGIINSDSTSKIDDASGINVAGTSDRNSDVDQPDKSESGNLVSNAKVERSPRENNENDKNELDSRATRSKSKAKKENKKTTLLDRRAIASLRSKIMKQRSMAIKKVAYSFFECGWCGMGFHTRSQLVAHRKKMHANDKPHRCTLCDKTFKVRSQLDVHIRHNHTNERPYKCEICPKAFHQSGAYKYHQEMHIKQMSGVREYQCTVCGKKFLLKRYLQQHMIRHNNADQSFVCSQCGKSYKTRGGLEKHEIDHSEVKRPHQCQLCNKGYFSKKHLVDHIRSHTGEKPFQCNHCGKCFPRKRTLVEHEMIHTGEKPYKCSFCDQCFVRPFMLRAHESNYHTGKPIFPCKICGRNFGVSQALNKHMETHKERPILKCPHPGCDVTVRTEKGLKGHIDGVHGDGKKFKCSYCDKKYKDKYSLMLHARVHTGEKPFKCATCGMLYTQANPLKRHCESKGHVPVSLIDPAIKRRVAPIIYNSTPTGANSSMEQISNQTAIDVSVSEPQISVPTVEAIPITDMPLVYAPSTLHTLQGAFPPPPLPLPEGLQQPQPPPQPPSQIQQDQQQQQVVSSQELQRLESQTIDSSALGMYHPTLLPSHSYMTL